MTFWRLIWSSLRVALRLVIARVCHPRSRIAIRAGDALIGHLTVSRAQRRKDQQHHIEPLQLHFAPPNPDRYATRSSRSDPAILLLYSGIKLWPICLSKVCRSAFRNEYNWLASLT